MEYHINEGKQKQNQTPSEVISKSTEVAISDRVQHVLGMQNVPGSVPDMSRQRFLSGR